MKNIVTILIIILSGSVIAQNNYSIKLKNGSEIRGNLMEVDSSGAKIKTHDGSIWAYSNNEIVGIEKFVPKVSGKGVFVRAEIGIVGGPQVSPSIQIINGFSFNSHIDLGLGIGFETFGWNGYVPILSTFRYNLFEKHFTPFIDVVAGYEMPLRNFNSDKGGFTSGAKLGFTRQLGNRYAFSTSAGYRFAYLKEVNLWWDDFTTLREMHRFEIKFGLTFK